MKSAATDYELKCRKAAQKIGHKTNKAQLRFVERVLYANKRYKFLISANPRRSTPGQQKKRLEAFSEALQSLLTEYRALHKDSTAKTKFYKSLRDVYEQQSDHMKLMFNPYMNDGGYTEAVLGEFLELLTVATLNAPSQKIGHTKAELKTYYLKGWIAAVRDSWPKEPSIKFGLGNYVKGTDGGWKSISLDVLHGLAKEIEPKIQRNKLGNLMKEVIKNELYQPPAEFIWFAH